MVREGPDHVWSVLELWGIMLKGLMMLRECFGIGRITKEKKEIERLEKERAEREERERQEEEEDERRKEEGRKKGGGKETKGKG